MTIKELYKTNFEDAVTTLCYESDYYITSIEIIKDFIKKLLDEDNFIRIRKDGSRSGENRSATRT